MADPNRIMSALKSAGSLITNPTRPTSKFDSQLAEKLIPELLKLILPPNVNLNSQGKDDGRKYEKTFSVEMIPKNSVSEPVEDNTDDLLDQIDKMETSSFPVPENKSGNQQSTDLERQIKKDKFQYPESCPSVLQELLDYVKDGQKIEPDAPVKIQMGVYFRNSYMRIDSPANDVISRILISFGYKEKYGLGTAIRPTGKPDIAREIMLDSNEMMFLGPASVTSYVIWVGKEVRYQIPSDSPAKIMGMRGINNEKTTIRPLNYRRITLVLDFGGTKEMLEELTGESVSSSDSKPKMENFIKKTTESVVNTLKLNDEDSKVLNSVSKLIRSSEKSQKKKKKKKNKSEKNPLRGTILENTPISDLLSSTKKESNNDKKSDSSQSTCPADSSPPSNSEFKNNEPIPEMKDQVQIKDQESDQIKEMDPEVAELLKELE